MEYQQKGASPPLRTSEQIFGPDDLALDTGGQLQPSYEIMPKRAGHLACGELAVEYVLGPIRVADVTRLSERRPGEPLVQITWADDHGPSTAVGQYPVGRVFPVRMPGLGDAFSIRQGLDRAKRRHRDISEDTARLIAAHLHTGPTSALYDFAVDGAIRDRLFDELDDISRYRPYTNTWVQALARYCLGRDDFRPLPGWRAVRGTAWSRRRNQVTQPTQDQGEIDENRRIDSGPLDQEFLRSDLAVQLIDQAFVIGRKTRHVDVFASGSLVRVLNRTRLAG